MEQTEFLIIGGGPAGAATGIALKKTGRRCIVVDGQKFPRMKLCGGLFTGKSQKVLHELLGEEKMRECMAVCTASHEQKFSLWSAEKCMVEVMPRKEIVLIDRPMFDEWMIRHYQTLGGLLIEGDAVVEVDFEQQTARLKSGKEVAYQHLIAADGANGRVEQWLQTFLRVSASAGKARKGLRQKNALCLEINVDKADCPNAEGVRIHLGVIPKSYAWSFAKGNKVCLGLVKLHDVAIDVQAVFRSFLQSMGVQNIEKYPLRGAMLPFGNYMRTPAWATPNQKGSVLFVGDAARLVEPLTGEGIYYALQSGVYAAESKGDVSLYLKKVSYLHRLIEKGGKYQRGLMHPRALRFFEKSAHLHPHFIEHFYSTQIEERCLDPFWKIAWQYKRKKN